MSWKALVPMQNIARKIEAARTARRRRLAEQRHAVWVEHRRSGRRLVAGEPFRFPAG